MYFCASLFCVKAKAQVVVCIDDWIREMVVGIDSDICVVMKEETMSLKEVTAAQANLASP